MLKHAATRLASVVPVLLGVSIAAFLILKLTPGDLAQALVGPEGTGEQAAEVRRALGLDRPLLVQYLTWLGHALQGDLGYSFAVQEPVLPLLLARLQNTAILAGTAAGLALVLGLVAGVLAATRPGSAFDRLLTTFVVFGNSMPSFWLGLVLMFAFAFGLGLLPTTGMYSVRGDGGVLDLLRHLVLPALTLAIVSTAGIARITRGSMLEVIGQDYIRVARAKGLSEPSVLRRHALKNAFIPVLTVFGVQLGSLLGGTVLVETVFAWPGVGLLLYQAIAKRDIVMVQGGVLLIATVFVLLNLIVDLLYGLFDPRIRYG